MRPSGYSPRFGIVTALPKEFAAMGVMLDDPFLLPVEGDPNDYVAGHIPSSSAPGRHFVVVTLLKKTGNNSAAAAASHLIRSFQGIEDVLMVGIAGGIPRPNDVDKHVRLGDVVVSNSSGVVQYDNVKLANGIPVQRGVSAPPSAALLGKVNLLETFRIGGHRPWERHILRAQHLETSVRPPDRMDRLFAADDPSHRLRHPHDPNRRSGQPKLHYGLIGSANTLLKDPKARNALAAVHDLRAMEMEGSGIADSAWIAGRSYLLIRGISDYCDLHKNDPWHGSTDVWQGYAAAAAAAYARALLESYPPAVDHPPLHPFSKRSVHRVNVTTPPPPGAYGNVLQQLSTRLLDQAGNKRTAYPTDLSFKHIYDRDVFVEPTFESAHPALAKSNALPFRYVLDHLLAGRNVLVLSEAGGGKSFFTYLVQRRLQTMDPSVTTLPLDLGLYQHLFSRENRAALHHADILRPLFSSVTGKRALPAAALSQDAGRALFIIDGLDEITTRVSDISAVSRFLNTVSTLGSILVTCRRQDFENLFSAHVSSDMFEEVLFLREWEVEDEFREFLRKLQSAGLLDDMSLLESVRSSQTLRQLTSRPLHARMLTFVMGTDPVAIRDLSQLYATYFDKYAAAIDRQLNAQQCFDDRAAYSLWKHVAWRILQKNLFKQGNVRLDYLSSFLVQTYSVKPSCATRVLDALFNTKTVYGSPHLEFIHYSFFEFLVADHVAETLRAAFVMNSKDVRACLSTDLTPEMRHYLLRILNRTTPGGFSTWLAGQYCPAAGDGTPTAQRRIINNLVVYVLGRLHDSNGENLWRLLEDEDDGFLRTSLYWGLCSIGDQGAFTEYVEVLQASDQMRSLNRGYLLYYYGDLDRRREPPYHDDDPRRSWANTKTRTLELMTTADYATIRPARRGLDLFTLYDFCLTRGETVEDRAADAVQREMRTLRRDIGPGKALTLLEDMHRRVCPGRDL